MMRHAVNNDLAVIVASAELMQCRPVTRDESLQELTWRLSEVARKVRQFKAEFDDLLGLSPGSRVEGVRGTDGEGKSTGRTVVLPTQPVRVPRPTLDRLRRDLDGLGSELEGQLEWIEGAGQLIRDDPVGMSALVEQVSQRTMKISREDMPRFMDEFDRVFEIETPSQAGAPRAAVGNRST
jgi:hypothetical protein